MSYILGVRGSDYLADAVVVVAGDSNCRLRADVSHRVCPSCFDFERNYLGMDSINQAEDITRVARALRYLDTPVC